MITTARRWQITILAGAGLFLLQLGWIVALAPDFGIDEFDHVYRAGSVAAGHWQAGDHSVPAVAGRGDLIPVRADIARTARAACEARPYTGPLNCRPVSRLGNGEVLIASAAARYNPTFYAVVGTAAKPFHGDANLYAMRIATALLAGALFMLTIWLALGGAATVWPLVAILLAALPTTIYSTALASPNGVEILAGLGVWIALTTVVGGPRGTQRRTSAYAILALCAGVLANTHTLGVVWLGLILVTIGLVHGPITAARRLLPRSLLEGGLALAVGAAVGFELVWLSTSSINDPSQEHTVFSGSPWGFIVNGFILWPLQAIGAFPMRNDHAPPLVYALLIVVLTAFLVAALRRTKARSRNTLGLAFVAVVSFALPAVLTLRTFHEIGTAWQGRYGMPFALGLLVIAGGILDASAWHPRRARLFTACAVMALVIAQAISQIGVVNGQRRSQGLVDALGWTPPNPFVLLALALLALVCWTHAVRLSCPKTEDLPVSKGADRDRRPVAVLR